MHACTFLCATGSVVQHLPVHIISPRRNKLQLGDTCRMKWCVFMHTRAHGAWLGLATYCIALHAVAVVFRVRTIVRPLPLGLEAYFNPQSHHKFSCNHILQKRVKDKAPAYRRLRKALLTTLHRQFRCRGGGEGEMTG